LCAAAEEARKKMQLELDISVREVSEVLHISDQYPFKVE
jgi:hypothetical protein